MAAVSHLKECQHFEFLKCDVRANLNLCMQKDDTKTPIGITQANRRVIIYFQVALVYLDNIKPKFTHVIQFGSTKIKLQG